MKIQACCLAVFINGKILFSFRALHHIFTCIDRTTLSHDESLILTVNGYYTAFYRTN